MTINSTTTTGRTNNKITMTTAEAEQKSRLLSSPVHVCNSFCLLGT